MKLSSVLFTAVQSAVVAEASSSGCRCLPEDSCWPSTSTWTALNESISGALIATIPIGSPCHDPNFNETACEELQTAWTLPQTHLSSTSSVMQAYFANQSCDPFTPESQPCVLGNYVSYAVNVSSADQVMEALAFAQTNNIRVVVRNTGHDFLGRSTGAGALSLWTHNLKTISFTNWTDAYYNGPAVKVGAGVLGYEVIEAAHAQDQVVVTGECPTVGMAGGYIQGGGHSALSTTFGLAADQALEFEVVTAAGDLVVASRTNNTDLYWALSGGGGGTYGVVLSVTVRTHPEATVGGASLEMAAAYTSQENFTEAISAFHTLLPAMIDQGAMVIYYVTDSVFVIDPITVYNSTADYVENTILAPFTAKLAELGIPSTVGYTELSYRDHYNTYMGPLPYGNLGVEEYQFGSRMIPRSVLEDDNDNLQAVLQNLTANGVMAVGTSASYVGPSGAYNAANPAWRNTTVHMQLMSAWNSSAAAWPAMIAAQKQMTDEFVPQLTALTPGMGAYLNEADFNQPDWQETFFGSNYDALLAIKNEYDPESLFYILKGVGSEAWNVTSEGRMCRV
ncbi:FAD binding domain protein [Coniella lustricola]|uniref:FAD binding domain protein n=1 Tax=Coniella lustricola TaxID=2025994 RepID=A0A2T2ZYI2_9PEZI|nr:FAD binding domain protein [Coniella lustricola]